ncbi:MAG: ABC transporter permease [Clostridiales Family XIII bacterium]|jgi:ribose transport system permease protein|nr:ABC transporter permease [Clostridiales Family XIII bacterium]
MKNVKELAKTNVVILCILAVLVVMAVASPNYFSLATLTGLLSQISVYGIVACAMTMAIICGEFDLSVGSILPFSTLLFAGWMPALGVPLTSVLVVLMGLGLGAVNGFFVAVAKINAFIVTLATMVAIEGVMLTYCEGMPIPAINDVAKVIGKGAVGSISYITIIFFVCIAVTHFVLRRTVFGRNLFATGGSYDVAKFAGIPVRFTKFMVFVILGGSAALAGILLACRLQAGSPLYGQDVCMQTVAAAVLGGASLAGGRGSVLRTFWGMVFIGMLAQVFTYLNVYVYFQQLISGAVVVAVVIIDAFNSRRKAELAAGI